MIMADSFIAFCTLILAVLFYLDIAKLGHVYPAGFAFGRFGFSYASDAGVCSLLAPKSELIRIAGSIRLSNRPVILLSGRRWLPFYLFYEMTNILLLDVIGAALACTSLLFVKILIRRMRKGVKVQLWKEAKEAYTEVRAQNGLSWLFILSILATFFIMPVGYCFR